MYLINNKNKKIMLTLSIYFLCFIFLFSCNKYLPPTDITDTKSTEETHSPNIEFSKEEQAFIKKLQTKGELRAASIIMPLSYYPQEDGTTTGFNYLLLKSFADYVEVDFQVIQLESFGDYFNFNGSIPENVKTDPNIVYTPDLFNEVDIFIGNFTILPWRQKLMRFVKTIPNRQMLITRVDSEIKEIKGLSDLRLVLLVASSYHDRIKELEKEYQLELDIYFVEEGTEEFAEVSSGNADATIKDSIYVFKELHAYKNLSVNFPISETEQIACAVRKDNEVLATILEKYFDHLRKSGEFDKIFQSEFNISITEYLNLLNRD